jgi:hypothetical protein
MKKILILVFAVLALTITCFQSAEAQFKIKVPKIGKPKEEQKKELPTIEQPETEQPTEERSPTTPSNKPSRTNASTPAPNKAAATEPSIAKDSVQVTPATSGNYHKNYEIWSWYPMMSFRVDGPTASGSQFYAEYNIPGAGVVKFDCRTSQLAAGEWFNVKDCSAPEEQSTTYTGMVSFAIKMRNELEGADRTLFTGKTKILKAHSNEAQGPKTVNHYVYYTDHDWNLPIGYVYLEASSGSVGMARPVINVAFWLRGEMGTLEPHLFYQGKEVGKKFYSGEEVGKPICDTEVDNGTTQYVADNVPQKAKWTRVHCTFNNVFGFNKTGETSNMFGDFYTLDKNPGEYEFKLLWNNHLARSIKFTVKPDGSFDNGIATANKLGSDRVIVPVQIIGDQDGPWDKTVWKTGAFYGNPLNGFTWQP